MFTAWVNFSKKLFGEQKIFLLEILRFLGLTHKKVAQPWRSLISASALDVLAPSIAFLLNWFLRDGKVPQCFKFAKCHSHSQMLQTFLSFRPILSKLLEKFVAEEVDSPSFVGSCASFSICLHSWYRSLNEVSHVKLEGACGILEFCAPPMETRRRFVVLSKPAVRFLSEFLPAHSAKYHRAQNPMINGGW